MNTVAVVPVKASKGLLIAGYVFAVLGGFLGFMIGGYVWRNKVKDSSGQKVYRYDAASRKQGLIIFIIGVILTVTYVAMRK